jgi:hypothetical protein
MELFKNLFLKYLAKQPVETLKQAEQKEIIMGTPADTLVTQHPDRVSQLLGPVYDYLKPMMPYSSVPQNLHMAVFFPAARNWPPNAVFADEIAKNPKLGGPKQAALFTKQNPGIRIVQDYVNKVEAISRRSRPVLSAAEDAALASTAAKLGVEKDSLYKEINFESGWDPKATNPYSGARGLVQFMPKTAARMGYAAAFAILPLLVVGGIVYFLLKRYGYL